MWCIVQQTRVS
jgi:hypothetical protein